ncbi:NAD(P)-dependent dehydrogenase (short-subunit alcohol dehydrogenase family) [Bradyrhizobium sp. LB13.1]
MTRTTYSSLAGRVVLITGGASGIGAAFVRAFAAQKARVALFDLDASAGEALVAEVAAASGTVPLFVPCDLLDIDALRGAMAQVHGSLGDAAVLVNNAANDKRQVLAEVTPAEFDWTIGVNLKHVFFAAQAVVPQMQARAAAARSSTCRRLPGCAARRRCRSTLRQKPRSSASPTLWPGWSVPTASASTR